MLHCCLLLDSAERCHCARPLARLPQMLYLSPQCALRQISITRCMRVRDERTTSMQFALVTTDDVISP